MRRAGVGGTSRGVAAVALVSLLSACWPAPGQGPDRRAHNAGEAAIDVATVGDLEVSWTADVGAVGSDPVVSRHGVHVTTFSAAYGIDVGTGAVDWVVDDFVEGPFPPMIVDGDRVSVVDAFDLRSVVFDWLATETGERDGDTRGGYVSSLRRPYAAVISPLFVDFSYYVGLGVHDVDDGSGWGGLLALEPAGDVTLGRDLVFHGGVGWNRVGPGGSEADYGPGVRAFPVVDGDDSCGPAQATVFACPTWAVELDGVGAHPPVLSADGAMLFVVAEPGTVHGLDASDGGVLWSGSAAGGVTAPPALADGLLYVPTLAGLQVFAADGCGAPTCTPLWEATGPGTSVDVQPAVAGSGGAGVVFTASADGDLAAFAAAGCGSVTCGPLWSAAGDPVTVAPAVTGGRLFVGTTAGLVAYSLP